MPTWKLQSPNVFLASWHAAMEAGEGARSLETALTKDEARRYANKFRAFRYCLREFDTFPAARIEKQFNCKLETRRGLINGWDIWLVIKPRIDLAAIREVLGEAS